jgi:hypothetical protein
MFFPESAYILFSIQNGANSALLLPCIPRMLIKETIKKISNFFPIFSFQMYFGDPFWGSAKFSTF